MYKKSEEAKHKERIHKLMSNGYRFAVIQNETLQEAFRYQYEAARHLRPGRTLVTIESLLRMDIDLLRI
ncbi:hypothetical protein CBW53_03010 [Yersinia frederiksenii]|nr:hypothetical protein CBW53_03010 [Yersinia frederiksenii]